MKINNVSQASTKTSFGNAVMIKTNNPKVLRVLMDVSSNANTIDRGNFALATPGPFSRGKWLLCNGAEGELLQAARKFFLTKRNGSSASMHGTIARKIAFDPYTPEFQVDKVEDLHNLSIFEKAKDLLDSAIQRISR